MKQALFCIAIIIFIVVLRCGLVGLTDEAGALRVLETDGVMNIIMTGYQPFGCGNDDTYHTGFRGAKNGREVEGVVCGGVMKAYTIRYY